ncbi:MAG TPA: OmpA family protein, partial [Rubellimicrobium sp.]|nr:OmpA family protein [Rubellimicrobium sp.]
LSPPLLAVLAFLCAGGLSVAAGQTIARVVETRSVEAVADQLRTDGFGWTQTLGDGLQVVLEGEAPTEADRFNAISSAAKVVDGARVIDNMRVADSQPLAPPDFALEILRNDSGVSLIGLVPAATSSEEVVEETRDAAEGQEVSDLLQVADYPVPEGWEPALDYALRALELLPRAKISVGPGRVSIEAISDSPEEQRRLESELARLAPDDVRLGLAISAPHPVIAPFTLRARIEDGKFAFDACSADSEEARDAILAAALAAGAEGPLDCRLGLGSPSPDWGTAAAQGIAALHALGDGTLTLSDADMALVAAPATQAELFDRVAGELEGSLPEVFALEAERPVPVASDTPQGPPEFTATLSADGQVRLQGRIEDGRMGSLARAFAQARFGAEDVTVATRPGLDGLPSGWSMRVLAGIEALSRLSDGTVTVTPDAITVAGRTGHKAARDEIAARAIETLGPDASLQIQVAYDEALDPLAALPTPEECLAKITAVTDAAKITFDPGSLSISSQGQPVIEAIAEILRSCPDLRLRISGYTDSQGREESNLDLSQGRAEAVLDALRAERVPVAGFQAQGYGEASPIASNETEAGREANRRIEFTLIGAEARGPSAAADSAGAAQAVVAAQEPADLAAAQPMEEAPDAPPLRPDSVEAAAEAASGGSGADVAAPGRPEDDAPAAEQETAQDDAGDALDPAQALTAIEGAETTAAGPAASEAAPEGAPDPATSPEEGVAPAPQAADEAPEADSATEATEPAAEPAPSAAAGGEAEASIAGAGNAADGEVADEDIAPDSEGPADDDGEGTARP